MSALPKRRFTPEEYLALEVKAEYKSQYIDGEIYAMAGTQPAHNDIVWNIAGELRNQFRGRPCKAAVADQRVRVEAGALYSYPDVAAWCGEARFDGVNPPCLLNPQVIFEVLSPSTEAFDRGEKFARYRLLESLTDYVLVSSERMRVEHFVRQTGGDWILHPCDQPADRLILAGVAAELPLAEIYDKVAFDVAGGQG